MERQLHRYFVGLVGFGFVISWSAAGLMTALIAVLTCVALVAALARLQRRPLAAPRARRRQSRSRPPIRARRLYDEQPEPLPLVPDEPSLILELG